MKYEKEARTKNGRRTWKITYELVSGPEPKKAGRNKAKSEAVDSATKKTQKKIPPVKRRSKGTAKIGPDQLLLL